VLDVVTTRGIVECSEVFSVAMDEEGCCD